MDANDLQRHIINDSANVIEALEKLNALPGNEMTLFVQDIKGRLTGTVTDGDIRRALIKGLGTADNVTDAMHTDFHCFKHDNISPEKIKDYRARGINIIPVVDEEGRPTGIVNLNKWQTVLPIGAILMAGGRGERLNPLTLDTPKPLLTIGGKAIIDYNIEALAGCGISDVTVCTRYLAEKIADHFREPVDGIQVKCVTETKPLGTIGAVSLVDLPEEGNTLVMNSDLITTVSIEDLYLRHIEEQADITIAVVPYQVSVPFAILTTDGNHVTGIEEKPSYSHYANAGIYMIANDLLRTIAKDTKIDATDLIEDAINDKKKVTFFPINGTWIDVGTMTDFQQAKEIMRHHKNMTNADIKQ